MTASLALNNERLNKIKATLQRSLPAIKAVLPKHMTGERMLRIVATAASRQPELLECTPLSIAQAVVVSSQLGLEPVGPLGQAYLVPFRNSKTGNREAQLIIGYKGMIALTRRSGDITNIEAHVIHEHDSFDICYGLESKLEHRPCLAGDPGQPVAAYAIARFRDGSTQTEVMSVDEIMAIKKRAKARESSPWDTDFGEMARKTVVKRLCKYLPLSVEMANAVALDNAAEDGENQIAVTDIVMPEELLPPEEPSNKPTKAESIADRLGASPIVDAELTAQSAAEEKTEQARPEQARPEQAELPEPEPESVPAAPKQEPAPAEPEPPLAVPDGPPLAGQAAAGKIYRKYVDFFGGDKTAAKNMIGAITGSKPSGQWTVPTVMTLEDRLAEMEKADKELTASERNAAFPDSGAPTEDVAF